MRFTKTDCKSAPAQTVCRIYNKKLARCNICIYKKLMDSEFDPAKDAANIAKHGVSLARSAELDLLTAAVIVDDRADYGETRFRAFGRIEGVGFCLAFTVRGTVVRPISFRRAHEKEMRRHGR